MAEPLTRTPGRTAREIAIEVARYLSDQKAENIVVIDVEKLLQLTAYFVIGTATSTRALVSLGDGLETLLKKTSLPRVGIEGQRDGRWVCMDHGDVVVHLFEPDTREFYDLDHLWGDAPRVTF